MKNSIKSIYEQIVNNKIEQKQSKKIKSLKDAYLLVTEKTAFYSKDFSEDTETSPDIAGLTNLGFVEKPKELTDIIKGISLRDKIKTLFEKGGWNVSKFTQLRDFEISFLTPISQMMAKHKLSNADIQTLIDKKQSLNSLETEIIKTGTEFNLLDAIKKSINFVHEELIRFCYYRSGKTTNDITFGDGEVLITLFTNGSKGNKEGDLVFPLAQEVEIKASGGRIDKPSKDAFYKANIRNFLLKIDKQLLSTSKIKADEEVTLNQQKLSSFIDSERYKRVFNSHSFYEKLLEIAIEFNPKTFEEFKNYFFKYKIPKQTSVTEKSTDSAIKPFQDFNYLNPDLNLQDEESKELFRIAYNDLKTLIDGFKVATTKVASDVFDKNGGTFIKNFFLQDFGLSLEETAQAFSMCSQDQTNQQKNIDSIETFLKKDDNFSKLKNKDESVLEAIIFALQLASYSKNNFSYILLINKITFSCISFNCKESPSLLLDLMERYIQLKNQNKIELKVQLDSRGGSMINLLT